MVRATGGIHSEGEMDNGESTTKAPSATTQRVSMVSAAVLAGIKVRTDWWPELAPLTLKERAYVRARVSGLRNPS